ncbi:hypothetical protein ONS95_003092 [Cadophora gregata]|uniref:uncharacterized protein n=1 Tax=Cadophora gregata TaxID=51156 RepID=UPI0026DC3CE6|nr:uncharacterized protein ONS95_003092 [Cadophora gregata]KAK0108274.1 hypothetical protein ONS95_003092 [Cadophora gregata]
MDTLKIVRAVIAKTLKGRATKIAATRGVADTTANAEHLWDTDASRSFPVGGSVDSSQATGSNSNSAPVLHDLVDKYILRLPCSDSLLPNQITNEVAFKRFVASTISHIPVSQVYSFNATDSPETSYIVEEFIDGKALSSLWMTFTTTQKETIARSLATIVVDLTEVRFSKIGGLDHVRFVSAPPVEGSKLFKGRGKFHKNECYPIGPYSSTKEYMLACYDKEIFYYSNADRDDIDESLFEDISVADFVAQLQERRAALAEKSIADEPFVLIHGDLHGRNILMKGDQIASVLDWDFAGSYPLSETLSDGGIDVVDANSEELEEENCFWDRKIREYIRELVEGRAWSEGDTALLLGGGDPALGRGKDGINFLSRKGVPATQSVMRFCQSVL